MSAMSSQAGEPGGRGALRIEPRLPAMISLTVGLLRPNEPVSSAQSSARIARDLNVRDVTAASGGAWSPQSLRRMLASPRISGQRIHHGEIVAKAVWPAIISAKDGAKIRALLANPERRTNKTARRYLLGGLLVCSHCGERLVARPRTGGQRRYACAKGPGFSGCGKTYVTAEDVERFVTEAVLHRVDSGASAAEPRAAAAQGPRRAALACTRPSRRRRSWPSSPRCTGSRRALDGGVRRRPQADRAAPQQRTQAAAKVSRTNVLDRYVGNGEGSARDWDSLDLSQQHAIVAAVVDSVVVGPARRGYNRFDESRLTPAWRP